MEEADDDDLDLEEVLDEFGELSMGAARRKIREIQFKREVNAHKVVLCVSNESDIKCRISVNK